MDPCRCGHAIDPGYACRRQPNDRCAVQYQARLSGPFIDRIDLQIEVPAVSAVDLILPAPAEGSAEVAACVAAARELQRARYSALGCRGLTTNAAAPAALIEDIARSARHRRLQSRARCGRQHAALGARLPSRAETRAHDPRSRGLSAGAA
jgi:predicted ATPase with chaperone activity